MSAQRPPGRRRRDRRGRGLRGALLSAGTGDEALDRRFRVPEPLPNALTRAERFDETVRLAVEELEVRWAAELARVDFLIEDVPPKELMPSAEEARQLHPDDVIPLSDHRVARDRQAALVVVYRRPLEARSTGAADLAELVFDVLVHEIADLLGRTPEEIDPEGHGGDEDDE